MAVAAQEIGQPKHVGIGLVADDDRPGAALDQPDAAEDQRAHDPLAEIGLGNEQARSRSGGIATASTSVSAFASTR